MPTIVENLAQVRALLDEPTEQQPSDRILFEILGNQVQHHLNQLQNSSAAWSVREWTINTTAGQEDYLVTAPDFGKPFLCYFDDPSNTYRPRVEIPFSTLQNVNMFYNGPKQVYNTTQNVPMVSTVTFYATDYAWYMRFTPIPGGATTYKVWYETLTHTPQSLGDTFGLSPFHHLVRTQTALNALPYCKWGEIRIDAEKPHLQKAWQLKTQAMAASLTHQEVQFQRQFDTYIAELMEAGTERRMGFGDGALDDAGFNIGMFGPNQF